MTCDHCDAKSKTGVLGIGEKSSMLNYYDRGSDFIWSDPVKAKDEPSTTRSFNFLMGPDVNVTLVHSDDNPTLKATCRNLGILRRASQPGDPQSNGLWHDREHEQTDYRRR